MKTAAICIATYRRPEGLDALLTAIRGQRLPEGWRAEVRVINNDPDADEHAWSRNVRSVLPNVMTAVERRRNIAHARNRAIAMATADAFLFIDDDEVPVEGWAAALIARLRDADAVFGPVIGRVPEGTPRWLLRSGAFDKPGPSHDGPIDWRQTRTSSTAVRAEWIGRGDRWFDPEYGTSGGSDVEFFKRIAKEGATFVHERRALVYEDVEPDRCHWHAVLRRRYRAGAVYGRMNRARSAITRHAQLAKRVLAGGACCAIGLIPLLVGKPGLVFLGACRAAIGIGAWRGHNLAYRVTRYPARTERGAACASPS